MTWRASRHSTPTTKKRTVSRVCLPNGRGHIDLSTKMRRSIVRFSCQSVALQDIADGLIADLVSQIGQRPRNSVITPVTVLLGHANDQLLNLSLDPRPAGAPTSLRAITLVGDKLAVPSQDGVRPRHIGHLGEDLAARAMTGLGQCGSLGVRELQPPFQLSLQDPIFGDQIFAPRQ